MKKPFRKVTIFKTASSKETATITLERLFKYIQEGRWRHLVDRIRQALERGDKKEADRLKKKLAYVCYGGLFRDGSHAAECLTEYVSLIVLDYDNVDPARLEQLKLTAILCGFTLMAYITPSGRGLKVVVLTNATREHHPQAYAMISEYYDQLLGIPSDGSCKDISRGHFVSYDYDARYNEDAMPFDVESFVHIAPVTEDEVTPAGDVPAAAPADAPADALAAATAAPAAAPADALAAATAAPAADADAAAAPYHRLHPGITGDEFVLVAHCLYPAPEGKRNIRLFHIACAARDRGIPPQDIVRGAIEHMACDTFDAHEITRIVKSAYSRKKAGTPLKKEEIPAAKCHVSDQVPLYTNLNTSEHDEEDENPDGEELREKTPLFPPSVYAGLPDFLSAALKYTTEPRETDMLLLSILTVVSALIPHTSGFYSNRRLWANFYTFVVAPAASGKGVMDYAFALCKYRLKDLTEENERLEKKYKEECEAYEHHVRTRKKDDKPLLRPEPPVYRYLRIPATISKSRFLLHLRDNGELGGFIFDLEADTMSANGKQDYGNYFDYLRKIFQHETVEDSFKVNEKPTYVHHPKLSILIAGTPAQLVRLIPTPEDGLYSRFLYYTHGQRPVWKDVSPLDDEEEVERHFDRLAMRLNQMLLFLSSSPTRVKLSKAQWARLNKVYSALLAQEEISDCDDFQSTIKRYCLITFRICMVLTSVEKATLRMNVTEVPCSDRNFETALSIVTTCLEHSRLLITSLRGPEKVVPVLQNPNKMTQVFDHLPPLFTVKQYMEAAALNEIGRRTAFRVLKRAIGVILRKISKGVYQKVSKGH